MASDKGNPCLTCGKDAGRCIGCPEWRSWWIARWNRMRRRERRKMEKVQVREVGIRVGGRTYSHPDQVRRYMAMPPCDKCNLKALCDKPCPVKNIWEEKRRDYLKNGGKL